MNTTPLLLVVVVYCEKEKCRRNKERLWEREKSKFFGKVIVKY
jgi:hypothetical protein